MESTFFFYDLETSGLDAREDRIMQFAGQRTDLELNPIGEPVNLLVTLPEDTLPSPEALMVTKITPLQTKLDCLTEKEFCDYVMTEVFTPNTIVTGYNSIHFDDEFMRFTFWRNFYDSYEWQWKDGRSRWDLLDVVRMTRALRPEGINWPFEDRKDLETGEVISVETNRLEHLSKANNIEHDHAHVALSDVFALIGVTKLIKEKQPQLYNYLLEMRDKKRVAELVNLDNPQPIVYTSRVFPGEIAKTSVVYPVAKGTTGNILVLDLRHEPSPDHVYQIALNKCPTVAPLGVLTKGDAWKNIKLDLAAVKQNLAKYKANPEILKAKIKELSSRSYDKAVDSESALYDGFLHDGDKALMAMIRQASKEKLKGMSLKFDDGRMPSLYVHYKARNYPDILTEDELKDWEKYRLARLNRQAPRFLAEIETLQKAGKTSRGQDCDPEILQALLDWYQMLQSSDYD